MSTATLTPVTAKTITPAQLCSLARNYAPAIPGEASFIGEELLAAPGHLGLEANPILCRIFASRHPDEKDAAFLQIAVQDQLNNQKSGTLEYRDGKVEAVSFSVNYPGTNDSQGICAEFREGKNYDQPAANIFVSHGQLQRSLEKKGEFGTYRYADELCLTALAAAAKLANRV